MNKAVRWSFVNGIFMFVLYLAFVEKMPGALNVTLFLVWVCNLISLILISDSVIQDLHKKGTFKRAVPKQISMTFDAVVCGVLVWNGYVITGAFFVAQLLLIEHAFDEIDKLKAKEAVKNE